MVDRKDDKEIHELKTMLINHMQVENTEIKELLDEIKALREEVKPLIDIYTDSIGAYKVITFSLKFIGIIAAGVGSIIFLKRI